jgi:uncharacterized protein (TIGR02646 family)
MRRLFKPWPPADVSPEGQDQCGFADAEQQYLDALPSAADPASFARSEFDRLEKRKLRSVMYEEQRYLCAYCEREIKEGGQVPRIDHWRPLSKNHRFALHWKNLYLSCSSPETCDGAKGDRSLKWDDGDSDLPWPTDFDYERHLGFTSRGDMYVRNDTGLSDATRWALELAIDNRQVRMCMQESILNLNHPALVAARAAAIDSERARMGREFKGKTATPGDRKRRADSLMREDRQPSFISIRICWLRRNVGRGR